MRSLCFVVAIFFVYGAVFAAENHVYAGKNQSARDLQNRGNIEADKGHLDAALRYYNAAIKLDSTLWPAYYNRALVYMQQHKWNLAIQDADVALREKSSFARSEVLRGEANAHLRRYKDALHDYDRVISLRPDNTGHPEALNNAAWIRATCPDASYRNGRLAVHEATSACNLTFWKNPVCIDTLAAAHAETGDFDSAVRFEQKAIDIGKATRIAPWDLQRIREHLSLFRRHRPLRDVANSWAK
jgi:tetratricopeptide (TPR) repeat protein